MDLTTSAAHGANDDTAAPVDDAGDVAGDTPVGTAIVELLSNLVERLERLETNRVPSEAPSLDHPEPEPDLHPGQIVSHTHKLGWEDQPRTRHGLVTAVHEPAEIGVRQIKDTAGNVLRAEPVHARHADVVWFNNDGAGTVRTSRLVPIG